MRKMLVTGGAGFIGANFIRHILSTEDDVVIINLDALTYAGSLDNLSDLPDPARHIFVEGDICDEPLVVDILRSHDIEIIVHFAAESHVDRSILGPMPFIQTNLVGTFTLLDAARKVWEEKGGVDGKRFHHVSTDEVYGSLDQEDPPFLETTPYDPRSPYSATKAGSDHLVRAYFHTYNLPITISNCSNNYGPYQFPEKLIPLMILNGLQEKPLPVYGDGKQIRDWLFVKDHCEAIQKIISKGHSGDTYNIGGGNQPTNIEIIEMICELLDELSPLSYQHRQLIEFIPDRPGHDRRYAMDYSKIHSETGWLPSNDLVKGLRATVEWYLSHLAWVEKISNRSGYNDWVDKNYNQRKK
ncbi:MAG TPA: dTDP-glucose 4,6-dehydratase [Anaerolineales bacterium]|nr:dTDP-glucose 4,6-dehydratase [Anaerolineales bacterium]